MADRDETTALLRAIADTLGIPVERFFEEGPSGDAVDAAELLRLWHCLRTPAGRAAALDALCRILDEEAA